jgi:MATE family multidrug resistance protein
VLSFIALREHRYGLGDSRSPMIAGLAGNALNIALNWVMVMQLGWGVRGSALATLFGHGAELVVVAWAYRAELGSVLPARRELSRAHLRSLFDVGVPTGVQFLLEMGSFALLTTIVSRIGEAQLAAHQIALQVIHFSFLPTLGVAEAAAVLAGQAVGARRDELVPVVARAGLWLSSIYAAGWTLAMPLVAAPIAACFTDEPALVAISVRLLWVAACFQIADGAAAVARGVLRGAGDVVVPARMGVLCAWVFTPPLAYVLGSVLGLGALGGWIGLLLEITTLALLVWWRIARGPWREMAAASRDRIELEAVAA